MSSTIPGVSPAQRQALSEQAHVLIRDAIAGHVPLGAFALHLQPDGVTLDRRDTLSRHLEEAGVRELARKIRAAVVPPRHVLVFIDCEETALRLVPLAAFTALRVVPLSDGGDS